jgi:hypothetical protein
MDRVDEYRRKAEEAERRAAAAGSDDEREGYEKIAKGWRDLIKAEERRQKRG